MNKYLLLLFLAFIGVKNSFSQTFKELFYQSYDYIQQEDYRQALPILFEMFELNHKNANTAFWIGNSYLHTANKREKAIPFYEEALKKLTIDYEAGWHKEKKAPLETYRFLGQAYHFHYEFEKALEHYEIYKSILDPKNKLDLALINRDIRITRNAMALRENPVAITLTPLDILNTDLDEYRPKLNAEENLMFFTSRRRGINDLKDHEDKYYEDIYFSVKEKGSWTEPVRVSDSINQESHDACLYISPDAQLMYVYRFDEGSDAGGSIYESRKKGSTWSEPVRLDANINSKYWETDASLNSFGNTIFFTSERPKGEGGRDIWMMKKLPNGKWADIQNLGPSINTEYDEESPYFHPDGKTLYFSSKGHNTMGGFDVFSSELLEDGTWTEPVNLGYPINTTGDDVFYFPSVDRKRAYFSSYRDGGKGEQDIYMMSLDDPKESALAIYKGTSKDCNGAVVKDLLVSISDKSSGEIVGEFRPNEETGEFLFILQAGIDYEIDYLVNNTSVKDNVMYNGEAGLQSSQKSVVLCGDSLSVTDVDTTVLVADTNLLAVDTVLTQTDVDTKFDQGETLIINSLYFVYDQVNLIEKSQPDLDKVLNYLKVNKEAKLLIAGHTDSRGEEKYNQWLSNARANKIKNFLYKAGVEQGRIETKGYGESKPIAPNENEDGSDNPEGRQKNRRVEFSIVK